MNLWTFCNTIIGSRPYRKERRRPLRRILGWCAALLPWVVLLVLWYVAAASGAM